MATPVQMGNDPTEVQIDAQQAEINRALTVIGITQQSDFELVAEGLACILKDQPLPLTITDVAMQEALNEIAEYLKEPRMWVRDEEDIPAYISLVKGIINERITLYKHLAQTSQQAAAAKYIREDQERRNKASIKQAELKTAKPPTGEARTYGLSPLDYLRHQYENGPSDSSQRNINIYVYRILADASPRTQQMYIFLGALLAFIIIATYILSLVFATWIGGSILSAAGWGGGFTAHKLLNFSAEVAGNYFLLQGIWNLYTHFCRSPETRDVFLGYRADKAKTLKLGIFFIAAALLQPLFMGIMNGHTYAFSLASTAIGLPLAFLGFLAMTAIMAGGYCIAIIGVDNLVALNTALEEPIFHNEEPIFHNEEPIFHNEEHIFHNEEPIFHNEEHIPLNEEHISLNEEHIPLNEEHIPLNEEPILLSEEHISRIAHIDELIALNEKRIAHIDELIARNEESIPLTSYQPVIDHNSSSAATGSTILFSTRSATPPIPENKDEDEDEDEDEVKPLSREELRVARTLYFDNKFK